MTFQDATAQLPTWVQIWLNILLLGAFILPFSLFIWKQTCLAHITRQRDCELYDHHNVRQPRPCAIAWPASHNLMDTACGLFDHTVASRGQAKHPEMDSARGLHHDHHFAGLRLLRRDPLFLG